MLPRMLQPYKRHLSSVSSLYALQIATLVLPLVLLPFLTRRLGPDVWGILAIQTSLSTLMIVVIEFGFGFGATREAAAKREDRAGLGRIVIDLLGARVLLALLVTAVWVAVWYLVPAVRGLPEAYWWTLGLTIAQGWSPAWFYQAIARLPYVMTRELTARVVSTIAIVLLVHSAEDAWLVPALQCLALALMLIVTTSSMLKKVDNPGFNLQGSWSLLMRNAHLCFTRLVQMSAPTGNTFLLGVISPIGAPIYGAAERTSNAVRGLLSPISQVAFPEIVVLYRESPARARSAVKKILLGLVAGAVIMAAIIWLLADLVVLILFGEEFASTVPVFRVLLCSVPLFAIIQVVGLQWLIPLKHDRAFLISAIAGVILNVGFALVLVPQFGAIGMAWSMVLSEATTCIGLFIYTEWLGPKRLRIFRTAA